MSKLIIDTPEAFAPLLNENARYLGAWGGRGSGKSHFFGEMIVETLVRDPSKRVVCVREMQKSLKESAYRLIADKIRTLGVSDMFRVLNDRIETSGGGSVIFQGMQDHTSESIKSLEGINIAWVEEAQTMSAKSLELLRPTIRAPGSQIWFSWNPRNKLDAVDQFLRGPEGAPDGAVVVKANWSDNPWFPKELEAERQLDRKMRPDRYGHIWQGEYEPQALGAIWRQVDISETRVQSVPQDLTRILVAVDPAVSSEPGSDEHGIVVIGLDESNDGYLLEDATTRGTPQKWAQRAVAMLDKWGADGIVIEKNQGGDMCRHTINSVRQGVNIIEVHSTRGKHLRAEPISALYALGKIHHVGNWPMLESQMCQFTAQGYEGSGSPDRVDALVHGFTELYPSITSRANNTDRHATSIMDYDVFDYEHSGRSLPGYAEI